jgi:pre-rRNA-processing protein TSR4
MAPTVPKDDAMMSKPPPAEAQDSWVDGQGAGDDNDWAMDVDADSNMQDLESKLAAMETVKVQPKKTTAPAPPKKSKSKSGSFPCYELSALQEPRSVRKEGLDEDDVGFSGSDAKIQAMLARYMAEEEDDFILAALKGSASGGEGGGDGRGERDERLSPADRALLTYSDRLKRSPRQVARYALGGTPLWSM